MHDVCRRAWTVPANLVLCVSGSSAFVLGAYLCSRFASVVGWTVPVHEPVREYTHTRPLSLIRVCVPGGSISTSELTSSVEIWMTDALNAYEGMGVFVSVGCMRILCMRWVASSSRAVSRVLSSCEVRAEVHSQESCHCTFQYLIGLWLSPVLDLWRFAVPVCDGVLFCTTLPSVSKTCRVSACIWVHAGLPTNLC